MGLAKEDGKQREKLPFQLNNNGVVAPISSTDTLVTKARCFLVSLNTPQSQWTFFEVLLRDKSPLQS